jgi:hypothetical protein
LVWIKLVFNPLQVFEERSFFPVRPLDKLGRLGMIKIAGCDSSELNKGCEKAELPEAVKVAIFVQ